MYVPWTSAVQALQPEDSTACSNNALPQFKGLKLRLLLQISLVLGPLDMDLAMFLVSLSLQAPQSLLSY